LGGRPQGKPAWAAVIVVDTSVWVDVLGGRRTKQARRCVELIEGGEPVALTDVIFTELLQGLRSEDDAELVERHLRAFPILRLEDLQDFALAASLYRAARRQGVTIRKTLDCLIAAPCIRTGAPLLHADADFDRLASCSSLRIFA
jgi:predicted nucleic acid-binding protein